MWLDIIETPHVCRLSGALNTETAISKWWGAESALFGGTRSAVAENQGF
jgi:hypothetical protein